MTGAQNNGDFEPAVPPDLSCPLEPGVGERPGVGDVVADEKDVGVRVGQGPDRVVGAGT